MPSLSVVTGVLLALALLQTSLETSAATCVLRWISTTDLSVHEDFLGMQDLEKTDAEIITTSLKDILLRCNFTIGDCRLQTYDSKQK